MKSHSPKYSELGIEQYASKSWPQPQYLNIQTRIASSIMVFAHCFLEKLLTGASWLPLLVRKIGTEATGPWQMLSCMGAVSEPLVGAVAREGFLIPPPQDLFALVPSSPFLRPHQIKRGRVFLRTCPNIFSPVSRSPPALLGVLIHGNCNYFL